IQGIFWSRLGAQCPSSTGRTHLGYWIAQPKTNRPLIVQITFLIVIFLAALGPLPTSAPAPSYASPTFSTSPPSDSPDPDQSPSPRSPPPYQTPLAPKTMSLRSQTVPPA